MADRMLHAVIVTGGSVYGPGYINPPPDDVAAKITNPYAWGEEPVDEADTTSPPAAPADEPNGPPVPTEPGPDDEPNGPPVPTQPEEPAAETVPVPPRSGAGSGRDAWRAFADSRGVSYGPLDTRDEIVEACEKAQVI